MQMTREKEAAEFPDITAAYMEGLCDSAEVFYANGEWERAEIRISESIWGTMCGFSPREWRRRIPLATRLRCIRIRYELALPARVEVKKIKVAKAEAVLEQSKADGSPEWRVKVHTEHLGYARAHLRGAEESFADTEHNAKSLAQMEDDARNGLPK